MKFALVAAVLLAGCSRPSLEVSASLASAQCIDCHAQEAEAWRGSMHDLAMQPATASTVLGNFDAAPLVWQRGATSHTTTFRRDNNTFVMRTENEAGEVADYEVAYTFGVAPLQQYLTAFPGGRLQCLPIAWDTESKRWFHLDTGPLPGDAFHWTGRYQSWNMMCAECHSTGLEKGYDAATDSYATTWSELNVTCTACHAMDAGHDQEPTTRKDKRRGELEACAPCHSRRTTLTGEGAPDKPFLDHFEPALLREGLYFPDGQIHEEVYVWGSFAQSRMFAAGVTCSDCHDPHSLKLKLPEGPGHNELCVQCHSAAAPTERFPTLAARDFDTPAHHHHEPGSEAARCTTCHMPSRTYMKVDARRDHRMGVPRPELSAELGTPDVCATCHTDEQAPDWAASAIDAWREEAGPDARRAEMRRSSEALLARGLFALWRGETGLVTPLFELAKGDTLTALQRATLVEALSEAPLDLTEQLAALAEDPSLLVRAAATRGLPGFDTPSTHAQRDAYNADFPATWLNRSQADQRAGHFDLAAADLRHALKLDPEFLPAVHNLAVLLGSTGHLDEARELLESTSLRHPGDGDLAYSLGLACAELGDLPAAAEALARAAVLMPAHPRLAYNYGVLLVSLQRPHEAEAELRRGLAMYDKSLASPGANEVAAALLELLVHEGRIAEAQDFGRSIAARNPALGEELAARLAQLLAAR